MSSPTDSSLELQAGPLRLALRPDLGGSIAGLWCGGLPVLRSNEPAALATSRAAGCYPLVPYSNRIGNARFQWLGQSHTTRPNFDDVPHSVHGMGWQRPWRVVSSSANAAELALHHAPDADWPFAFDAVQRFELDASGVQVRLAITNRHHQPQPVGLGWHPYFHKRSGSQLQIDVTERWNSDAAGLPTAAVAQPGIHGAVADMAYDNCFSGWVEPALFGDDLLQLRLTSSLKHLVVFTPGTKPYYCVEPVSHVSNAIQMADPEAQGLVALAPHATFEAWMRLEVRAA